MGPRKRPFLRPNGPRPVVRMSTGCFKSWAKKGVYSKIRSFEFQLLDEKNSNEQIFE